MSNQIDITGGARVRNLNGVITGTTGVLSSVPLGGANGVATLDSGGKVPVSQLPSSVVTYLGTWNAATNTPTLVNGTGDAGDLYLCNVAGTVNFGAGPITFAIGDWVLYGSGTWQKSNGQNGTVTSVAASITGNSIGITGSPITTAGTLAFAFAGTSLQYINGAGNLTTFPSLTGYVPYTGATNDLNLGTHNLFANNLFDGFTNVAASGTQIVLTIASTPSYTITGSGGQTIKLPDATTLPNGAIFSFNNNQSSGAITINNNSNTLVVSVPSGGFAEVVLLDNSIAAGSWDRHFKAPSNVSWSTNTLDYAGSITSATWNGNVVAINRGGTGSSTQNFVDLTTTQTIGGAKTFTSALTASSLIKTGGTSSQFLKADGSVDSSSYITLTSLSATSPIFYNSTTGVISSQAASATQNGYLTSTDWTTFNSKGSGTVTSVAMSVPTGLSITGSPITTSGTLAVTFTAGYSIPTNASQTTWDTAYTNRITSLTVTGSSGSATLLSNVLNIPTYTLAGLGGQPLATNLTSVAGLTYVSTSFVKMTAAGTFALDTNTYLTTGSAASTYLQLTGGTLTGNLNIGNSSNSANLQIFTNGTPLQIFGVTYPRGFFAITYDVTPDRGITFGNELWFNTNATIGTNIGTNALKLSSTGIATFASSVTATSFIKTSGTSSQFLKADGSVDSSTYLTTSSASSTYVPYTGATGTVNLGANDLSSRFLYAYGSQPYFAQLGADSSGGFIQSYNNSTLKYQPFVIYGGSNTTTITTLTLNNTGATLSLGTLFLPNSISGRTSQIEFSNSDTIALLGMPNLTSTFYLKYGTDKIYFNNDSGGDILTLNKNATAIFSNSVTASSFIKSSGTSSQFLKADGSVDSSTYLTTSTAASTYVPYTGATTDVNLGSRALSAGNILGTTLSASQTSNSQPSLSVTNSGTFRIADFNNSGALVAYITNAGSIYGYSFVKSGGSSSQFLKADGSVDSTSYYSSGGGIITGNVYMQSSGNPSQLLAKGTNTEFWVDSYYGGGTARAFINRSGTGNQATLMFSTGVAITNGTAWAGACDWSMGMTNDSTNNFYIGYGDIFSSTNRKITIASSGNLGLNNIAPAYLLDVSGVVRHGTDSYNGDTTIISNSTPLLIRGRSPYSAAGLVLTWDISPNTGIICSPNLGFNTNATLGSSVGTRALTITSSGVKLFCDNAGGSTYSFNITPYGTGNALANKVSTTAGWDHFYFQNPNGNVGSISTSGSVTTYNVTSDYRLKDDFKEFNGLSIIDKIKIYDFQWKVDKTRMYGVVAHELQEILPIAVTGKKDALDKDGEVKPQGVDYSKIVPILVKAIQELKLEIQELKNN